MTRISISKAHVALCTTMDILFMKNNCEPEGQDAYPFIEVHGNHATINTEAVLYNEDELHHVYTKRVFLQAEKKSNSKSTEQDTEEDIDIYH